MKVLVETSFDDKNKNVYHIMIPCRSGFALQLMSLKEHNNFMAQTQYLCEEFHLIYIINPSKIIQ